MNTPNPAPPAIPSGRDLLKHLEGLTVEDGWIIGRCLPKEDDQSGGHFSEGYECVSPAGRRAFLKAIDLFEALSHDNVLAALHTLSDGVLCEQELLKVCRRMDRVVSALAFGEIREFNGQRLLIPVPYIIFERADGNVRHIVRASARPAHSWILRTLHHVATGLMQLHRARIAHLDLKPSNALRFEIEGIVKVADLGRSVRQDRPVWYDQAVWPGDQAYAPPEVAYGLMLPEFNARRFAADLYLLGSFATTLLTGAPVNTLLYTDLPADFRPPPFGGAYSGTFEHVLAHLHEAFDHVMVIIASHVSAEAPYREELLGFIRQWCTPDPRDRGHPLTRARHANGGNIYDLERYVSALTNLALKAGSFERVQRARQDRA